MKMDIEEYIMAIVCVKILEDENPIQECLVVVNGMINIWRRG
jgi:hypothetical protein